MPTTPAFNPADAIVSLGGGRKAVNVAMYIVGMLRDLWQPQNTDGVAPDIDTAQEHKVVSFTFPADWITIYQLPTTTKVKTLGYQHVNQTYTFSLDMHTGRSLQHLTKMYGEAQRVCWEKRKDTFDCDQGSGRVWLDWGSREQPFDKMGPGHYRIVVDCKLSWAYRAVQV